jgi:hypothetical protein
MSYQTEIVRKVYDNDHGEAITIAPSPDFPGNVLMYTEKCHEEYFGKLRLDLPAEMMRQLGQALIEASEEASKSN